MTPRDTILAQRAGFVAGIRATHKGAWGELQQMWADAAAERTYPMPRVTRPRVIQQGESEYKIENGQLMVRYTGDRRGGPRWVNQWRTLNRTRDDYLALAMLFDSPTEEVEI